MFLVIFQAYSDFFKDLDKIFLFLLFKVFQHPGSHFHFLVLVQQELEQRDVGEAAGGHGGEDDDEGGVGGVVGGEAGVGDDPAEGRQAGEEEEDAELAPGLEGKWGFCTILLQSF